MFAGSFAFLRANLFLFPAITVASLLQVAVGDVRDAGAVVAVEEQPRTSAILYAGIIFFTKAIYGAMLAITGDTRCRGCRSAQPRRRSSTSSSGMPPALRDAVAGLALVVSSG